MDRVLYTVNQFCDKHSFITKGGLRFQIFNEYRNGLRKCGVVIRIGKKVLIDEARYFAWIDDQQEQKGRGVIPC